MSSCGVRGVSGLGFEGIVPCCFQNGSLSDFLSFGEHIRLTEVSKSLKSALENIDDVWIALARTRFGANEEMGQLKKDLFTTKKLTLFFQEVLNKTCLPANMANGYYGRMRLLALQYTCCQAMKFNTFSPFWREYQVDTMKQSNFIEFGNYNNIVMAYLFKVIDLCLMAKDDWRQTCLFLVIPGSKGDPDFDLVIQFHRQLVTVVATAIRRTSDPTQRELLGVLSMHAISLLLGMDDYKQQFGNDHLRVVKSFRDHLSSLKELIDYWRTLISGNHDGDLQGEVHIGNDLTIRNRAEIAFSLYEGIVRNSIRGAGISRSDDHTRAVSNALKCYSAFKMTMVILRNMKREEDMTMHELDLFVCRTATACWKDYLASDSGYWAVARMQPQQLLGNPPDNGILRRDAFFEFCRTMYRESNLGWPEVTVLKVSMIFDVIDCLLEYRARTGAEENEVAMETFIREGYLINTMLQTQFLDMTVCLLEDPRLPSTVTRLKQELQRCAPHPSDTEVPAWYDTWESVKQCMEEVINRHPVAPVASFTPADTVASSPSREQGRGASSSAADEY